MPLHTVEEAAELMKVSPDTVREWVRSGRLRASKLAGSKTLRISTDDITAFYDANETRAKEEKTHADRCFICDFRIDLLVWDQSGGK